MTTLLSFETNYRDTRTYFYFISIKPELLFKRKYFLTEEYNYVCPQGIIFEIIIDQKGTAFTVLVGESQIQKPHDRREGRQNNTIKMYHKKGE